MTTTDDGLHIDDGGQGEAVVLIHSAGGTSDHFAALLPRLRRTRRAIAFDLRGHGRSPALPDGLGDVIAAFAEDVEAVRRRCGLERFTLVGHSLGGAVACRVAALQPQRVSRLLLLDPASDGRLVPREIVEPTLAALRDDERYAPAIEGYWASLVELSPAPIRERLLADLRATPRATMRAATEVLFRHAPQDDLGRYGGPAACLATPVTDHPGGLHRLAPALAHEVLDGVGHWLHLDAPERVRAWLDRQLA